METLSALGTSDASAAELAALADRRFPGRLIIVHSPASVDGVAAAAAVARASFADPEVADLDVHVVYPDTDRWTVEEVDHLIIGPSRLRPYERTHIVVTDAELMASTVHDHLLKTIEEPSADTVFWFCVAHGAALPATLRGRATHTIHLAAAPLAALTQRLASVSQVSDEVASAALTAAGADLGLAAAALYADRGDALTRAGTLRWRTSTPTATADSLLLDLASLAIARTAHAATEAGKRKRKVAAAPTTKGSAARLDAKKLSPQERALVRRMLRATLARWSADIVTELPGITTAAELRAAEVRLAAIGDAHTGLAWNTPLATITAAALARMNPA